MNLSDSILNVFNMQALLNSRLHSIDRCIFNSKCLDCGWRKWFLFPFFSFSWWAPIPQTWCLWGRHHQPKRLKAPLKQFQRISLLDNNSTVFTQMPKYKTSMTSNIFPQPLQSTLVTKLSHSNAFNSGLIYCYLEEGGGRGDPTDQFNQCH